MDELIRRQAVQEMIDRIGGMYPYRQIGNRESYSRYNEAWTDAINRVDAELNSLPSAQPERMRGKWLDNTYCSECGWANQVESGFIGSVKGFNYCPNCGAKMKDNGGKQDE